ncbi:hypothetical protein C0993_002574 [Termitomyces sp. T159_Od127]|nr:hypothetical protein C0993_002574 [Termitomyces sp. T159_Od127]
MFQSTVPSNVSKRSLSPEAQDPALPLGKKQKERKGYMPDELHHKSDQTMKQSFDSTKKQPIHNVIRLLWRSVVIAEMMIEQLQFGSVLLRLKDAKYLEQPELENLIDKCIANETWKELREHGLEFLETLKDVTDIEVKKVWTFRLLQERLLVTNTQVLTSYAEENGYEAVVLAIDEVHGLFTPLTDALEQNVFHCLRTALKSINYVNALVSLFLSTAYEVHNYAPPSNLDPGLRVKKHWTFIPPFTHIGFDQLAVGKVKKDVHYLRDMVSVEWMCQFGRPLFGTRYNQGRASERNSIVEFAAMKLLGGRKIDQDLKVHLNDSDKIAILATRIPLKLASRILEVDQVEHHMRFCLAAETEKMAITIAPSEPILAEGAHYIVQKFSLDQAYLLKVLSGPSLDKGDGGEVISLLLFILARDAIVKDGLNMKLSSFLNALLQSGGPSTTVTEYPEGRYASAAHLSNILEGHPMFLRNSDKNVSLQRCFEHSEVHFNHFIRIEHASAMNRNTLYGLIARGAAILCCENQPGVDVIIPFVFDARKPVGPDNVSVILCQVRNAFQYTTKVVGHLFETYMDPFKLGVFNPPDEQAPIPFIRMVMALGSPDPGISILSPPQRNPPQDSKPADKYTAYDIWCARACSSTFKVITPQQNEKVDGEISGRHIVKLNPGAN